MTTFRCAACHQLFDFHGDDELTKAIAAGFIPDEVNLVCDKCYLSPSKMTEKVPISVDALRVTNSMVHMTHPDRATNWNNKTAADILADVNHMLSALPELPENALGNQFPNPCDVGPYTYDMLWKLMRPVPLIAKDISEVESMTVQNTFARLTCFDNFAGITIHQRTDVAEGIMHPCTCNRRPTFPVVKPCL